ncbi:molybdopterin-dependent oxidoreductase [Desulfohalobium retbaense]|uniref:Molybdopterin oxidoreductase n=1 Tax=Desulfohalobium retbaense (strain ATCC 49708 / DSM 5692 / JCM 16813 / HR100) TaxID=485915 RepID=C8X5M1_DESRD|nr:molybdopterin-dependent oxidoreductase [Desulfohalobium retbaense]ACV69718.1 molybdopterin oxidoreductase [Desulfohalobium retbaense DSM 5692]
MHNKTTRDHILIFRFFSQILRDEVPSTLLAAMQAPAVADRLRDVLEHSHLLEVEQAGKEFVDFLVSAPAAQLAHGLRFDYAELFLNVGANPVFPYESCHMTGQPVVRQKNIFALRSAYREAGLRPAGDYFDLDEHIAVELDFLAALLQRGREDQFQVFFTDHFSPWALCFCEQLASAAASVFYRDVGMILRGILRCTLGCLGQSEGLAADKAAAQCRQLAEVIEQLGLQETPDLVVPGEDVPSETQEIPTHCYTCGALCGMRAKVQDGVLVSVSGLPGDPKGGGRLCPKGGAAPKHLYSAYRLKTPLVKEDGRFRKASWDEALDRVVQGIRETPQGQLGYFRGNDFCNWIHEALFDHLGCPKGTHRTMCDNANRMWTEHCVNDKRPWLNYEEADYILHFGMNELATSYGQRKTAELKQALKRGAKLVVFDPRKSDTAAKANEWIPIKPGTDGAVAMAMAHVLLSEALYDQEFVQEWTYGFEAFKARVLGQEDGVARTPQWAESISGVPAETIARIAREFAAAKAKGALSWTGLAQVPNGYWSTGAVQALNALCGTYDAPGGPSLPFKRKLKPAWGEGQTKPPKTDAPKLDSFSMWSGWSPAVFEQDIDAGRLTGMVGYWGDPVLSWGNSESVRRGLDKMAFKAMIEAFMCDTALQCDVILPDATWLEQSQVKPDWLYEAFIGYFAEVVPPMYDTKPMWRITQLLAQRLGLGHYFPWNDVEEAFANMFAGTPWSFEELKAKGFLLTDQAAYYKYKEWGGCNPPEGYGSSGTSKTGKFNLKNPVAEEKGVDALPDYKAPAAELTADEKYPFIFGNFRLFQHEHCSTFNNFQLMKLQGTNTLWINDSDAQGLQIVQGDQVRVQSPWGEVVMQANPTADIAPGVLAAAGGFGHKRGLEGDPKFPHVGGVNATGELQKPNTPEAVGGTPLLKYIKTRVEKV